MKTIIFLGTQKSGSSREAIIAAEKLGYLTCLLTNHNKHLKQREEYPDVHLMYYCDLNDIKQTKELIKDIKQKLSLDICAIVAFTDPWCGLASLLSKEFGLHHYSTEAIYIMQNKLQSREVLQGTDYIPKFVVLTELKQIEDAEIEKMLPVVVKYVDSNGSKDVYLCDTMELYHKYTTKLFEKYPGGVTLIEEFLDGPQYIVESVVINSNVHIVGIIEQEIQNFNEHFIITGYNLLFDYTPEFYNELYRAVEDIINKHHFENGPCHLEMRFVKNKWKLIEVNPRISGAGMSHLLKIGLGIDLVKETLKLSLNENIDLEPQFKHYTFSQYVVVEQMGRLDNITGKSLAASSQGVKHVYVKPRKGAILVPPSSLGDRYAYVIAIGDSKENARYNAKEAANKIVFHLK